MIAREKKFEHQKENFQYDFTVGKKLHDKLYLFQVK